MSAWLAARQVMVRVTGVGLDVVNWLVLYLPVLLMGLLAFLTYGLLRNTPTTEPDRPEAAPRHEPDYIMERVVMRQYKADGQPNARLQAQALRHYPDTNTLNFENPVLLWHSAKGGTTRAQARLGQTNADGSEVALSGAVQVVRQPLAKGGGSAEPDLVMRTEYLLLDSHSERMSTNQPVQVQRGGNRIQGQRMQYDHALQQLEMMGQVRVVLAPTARH